MDKKQIVLSTIKDLKSQLTNFEKDIKEDVWTYETIRSRLKLLETGFINFKILF